MSSHDTSPLERACALLGGQKALGEALGVSQQRVWWWVRKSRQVPAEFCLPIERATSGVVQAEDLRPDVFGRRESAA